MAGIEFDIFQIEKEEVREMRGTDLIKKEAKRKEINLILYLTGLMIFEVILFILGGISGSEILKRVLLVLSIAISNLIVVNFLLIIKFYSKVYREKNKKEVGLC